MKTRRLKTMAFVLLLAATGVSTTKAQTLVLHHANGKTTDVQLYTMPKVTFQDDKVLITSSVLDMEYPKEDILRFTYKGSDVSVKTPSERSSYTQKNNKLIFHDVKSAETIAVYRTNGIRVPVHVTIQGNTAILPLNTLQQGVYLLSIDGRTSKFTKR